MIEVRYKWPNDVLINDRKAAGILLESKSTPAGCLDWLVLGIGVNITSFPEDTAFPATSLRFEGCPPALDEVTLLAAFGRHFLSWVNRWLDDGFVPVRKNWCNHAFGLGDAIEVKLGEETLTGIFEDLNKDGCLLLKLADGGTRRISAGDVYRAS